MEGNIGNHPCKVLVVWSVIPNFPKHTIENANGLK